MGNSDGLHHISKRKRVKKLLQDYPHPKFWVRLLDRFLIIVAFVGPMMMIPQLWQIYFYKSAGDIAVLSWLTLAALNIPWMMYGIVHKERPIVLAYFLWFLVNMSVAVGALIY
ncbi:hypothetical protein CMI41_00470 [Candidatus Pacearchaeota archaeon]|nr:hypothetical protein [Candidatus Pacearchaeota archaeon]|tara:strand:- start:5268 stop:5606 length:339 start_codon:yes stop_codon:yes gene_type:complete